MSARADRHTKPISLTPVIVSLMIVSLITSIVPAQPGDAPARRVRGIIDTNETWSGHILITDHLRILNAVVTVQPGTLIEFVHAVTDSYPILSVGSDGRERGELRLLSKPDNPIVIRSRKNTNSGRIIYYVRDRLVSPPSGSTPPDQPPPAPFLKPVQIGWHHVRFENLGPPMRNRVGKSKHVRFEPAITFLLIGRPHKIHIADCTFDNTTRLEVRSNPNAEITFERNRFQNLRHRAALTITGSPTGKPPAAVKVTSNKFAAAIRLDAAPATLRDNILIGPNAAIVIRDDTSKQTELIGNYIHNTTKTDDGHYCLDTHNPNASITNNIIRGGTTCVLSGSRRMSGNVFIGAEALRSEFVKHSHTHQCVAALPAGSVFERNLLIGPAHALLVPQPLQTRADREASNNVTHIRHNIFVGSGTGSRAIHLNPIDHAPTQVSVANNLFLEVSTLFFDEGGTTGSLIYADHNAYAPPPPHLFDRAQVADIESGQPGWAALDIQRKTIADLGLSGRPPTHLPDFDDEILSGKLTITQLRHRLFSPYRPRANSPLVAAGQPSNQDKAAPQPAIGALEPNHRVPN